MKVGSAVLLAFPILVAFFTRWMVATRGQRVATTTPIGSIEFDFSILVLALLLVNDFMCFAASHAISRIDRFGLMRGVKRNVAGSGSEQVKEVQNRVRNGRMGLVINSYGKLKREVE